MDNRLRRETPNKTYAAVILGVMMILAGAGMIYVRVMSPSSGILGMMNLQGGSSGLISRALLIVGGSLILIYHKKGNYFAVGLYAMTLGLSRIVRSLPGLVGELEINYYISLVFVAIGINLFVSGFNHLTVRTKNPTMMRFTAVTMLSVYVIGLIYLYCNNIDLKVMLSNTSDMLWYLPLYVALILILSSREVMENIPMGRINRYSTSIGNRMNIGDSVSISPEDAEIIKNGLSAAEGWQDRDAAGMTVSEKIVTFRTEAGNRDVVLGRVPGKEGIAVSIVDDRRDSFVIGRRFRVHDYKETDGVLELYDLNGVCAVLNIGGDKRCV